MATNRLLTIRLLTILLNKPHFNKPFVQRFVPLLNNPVVQRSVCSTNWLFNDPVVQQTGFSFFVQRFVSTIRLLNDPIVQRSGCSTIRLFNKPIVERFVQPFVQRSDCWTNRLLNDLFNDPFVQRFRSTIFCSTFLWVQHNGWTNRLFKFVRTIFVCSNKNGLNKPFVRTNLNDSTNRLLNRSNDSLTIVNDFVERSEIVQRFVEQTVC